MKNKKLEYHERLFIAPILGRVEKVVFSHIPKKSEWISTSHYIHDPKIGHIGRVAGANVFRPPSAHKRTHRKGPKIRSIATFRKWCMNGGPIYYNHKFMHYGFATSMPFRGVCDALSQGRIWKAVRI